MIFLALSAFQGRDRDQTLSALLRHRPAGVQLTPGNLPCEGFEARVRATRGVSFRLHHSFCWRAYRRPLYRRDGTLRALDRDHSIHGPRSEAPPSQRGPRPRGREPVMAAATFWHTAETRDVLWETMYPGYHLGTGKDLERAMAAGLRLAVDIAHLAIQTHLGALTNGTRRRLEDYSKVEEIHVSRSQRASDAHLPLTPDTPGLDWARARGAAIPLILESRWHQRSFDEQRAELDLLEPSPPPRLRRWLRSLRR